MRTMVLYGGEGGGQKGGICSEGFLSFCEERGRQSGFWRSVMRCSRATVIEVYWSRIYTTNKYTKSDGNCP